MSQDTASEGESARGGDSLLASGEQDLIDDAEESAQGQDLYRAPGRTQFAIDELEQAGAPEWIVGGSVEFPSPETRDGVVSRRQELYDAMRLLERAVARPSGLADWRIDIEAALHDLRSALSEHVAQVEGSGGLFEQVLGHSPHLASEIDSLRRDHRELLETCNQALSMSADWDPLVLRRRVNMLLARLALHRQQGAELLFDAYNVDLAAGN
jgi:hypothetical protein